MLLDSRQLALLKSHISQFPHEFRHRLRLVSLPFQQLEAETGDVLLDLLDLACRAACVKSDVKPTQTARSAGLTFVHFIVVFVPLRF